MSVVPVESRIAGIGVVLVFYPSEENAGIELERAPDSGGNPDTGNSETIARLPAGQRLFADLVGRGGTWHYRSRHIRPKATAGGWTNWVAAKPVQIPDTFPPDPGLPIAAVTSCSISYDSGGDMDLTLEGNDDVDAIYVNVNNGSAPADPTDSSNDHSLASNSGTINTTTKVLVGEEGFVKAVGYTKYGQPGTVKTFVNRRGGSLTTPPRPDFNALRTSTSVTVNLDVADISKAVTAVEKRSKVEDGSDSGWGNWSPDTGSIGSSVLLEFSQSISVDPGKESQFMFRVTWDDEDGNSRVLNSGPIDISNLEAGQGFIELGPGSFTPVSGDSVEYVEDGTGWDYLRPGGTGAITAVANIQIPRTVDFDQWESTLYREDAGSSANCRLYEMASGGKSQRYNTAAINTAVYDTATDGTNFSNQSGTYIVVVDLDPDGGTKDDARFVRCQLRYDRPTWEDVQ